MSAIAYITDSKMLELHRLNAHKTMNFWRLSTKNNFSNFEKGDLVFFLSKDKEFIKNKEKGVVGFGKLEAVHLCSPKSMWDKYEKENGYNTYDEFKAALTKVNKDHKLPTKISSFYLTNVTFFQAPVYLSECGMEISNNVESYIYIKPEETVIKLLEYAKKAIDLWSSSEDVLDRLDEEELRYAISLAFKEFGDYPLNENQLKKAHKEMLKVIENNPVCEFVSGSKLDLCLVNERDVLIVLYNSKDIDVRTLIGQASLYCTNIKKYYFNGFKLYFKTSNGDKDKDELIIKAIYH